MSSTRPWLFLLVASCFTSAPPPPPRLSIEPTVAGAEDVLRCLIDGKDASGIQWTVDGAPAGNGATLPGPHRPGSVVRCQADGGWPRATVAITAPEARGGNILFILLDDVGAWDTTLNGLVTNAPPTPVLSSLAAQGVTFRQAWATPVCSPSRVGVLTGLYPHHHHVTTGVGERDSGLSLDAVTIGQVLHRDPERRYTTAVVGKWHITPASKGVDAPQVLGFDRSSIAWNNIGAGETGYFNFDRVRDGVTTRVNDYAPLDFNRAAEDFVARTPEPWFLYLPMPLAHAPFHDPPAELLTIPSGETRTHQEKFRLMINAADTLIGRVIDALPPGVRERTTIVVMGDNGTADETIHPPLQLDHAKLTPYEPGVRVPLIIVGPQVVDPGRVSDALVNHVDLFATFADLAGAPLTAEDRARIDGVSLLPLLVSPSTEAVRQFSYAEMLPERFGPFRENGWLTTDRGWVRGVRDTDYKVVRRGRMPDELYHIAVDPLESDDLLKHPSLTAEEREHLELLRHQLDAVYVR